MLKIVLIPLYAIPSQKGWDYIKSVHGHVAAHMHKCCCLTEYAIILNLFLSNIEAESIWTVKYRDKRISFWNNADAAQIEECSPFMVIEYDNDYLQF
jgi:hypothetical protein